MKSLVCHGPEVRSYEEKPMPIIKESTGAIVRITKTTVTIPMLLKTGVSGKLQPKQLITHHFTLDEVMQAYDTFDDAMKEEALKVIVTNSIMSDKVKSVPVTLGMAILEEKPFTEDLILNDSPGG